MIRNIILTAFRNFSRQPMFSGINIFGLAVGIASSLLIFLYVLHETSYDSFHPDAERLYRVNQTNIWSPEGGQMSSTVIPLASALSAEFPEIEATMRINNPGETLIQYEKESIYENNILAVDSNFFSFFGFQLLEGDPGSALTGKNKVVITEEIARKFFNEEPAVGKVLLFGDAQIPIEITGIVAELPANAHFKFDYLLSITTNPLITEFDWSWFMTPLVTYIKLKPQTSAAGLEEKLEMIAPKYIPPTFDRFNMNFEEFVADKGGWNFYLQPVEDIHLYSEGIGNRIGRVSDISYIYIFTAVALFILVLGCINFINLSTARASSRAKEVGVRKVLGSHKKQLIGQYLAESIMLSFIATIVGIALMELLRIILQTFVGIHLVYNWSVIWPVFIVFPLILGILAGIYPAFYLTAFEPAKVLKGNLRSGLKSAGFRNALVVVQFTVAIVLVVSTIIVQQQLHFLNNKNLGFDKENIIVVNHADRLGQQLLSYRNILRNHETVESASIAMDMPGRMAYEDMFTRFGDDEQFSISQLKIDPTYFKTMGLELASGKLFNEGKPADFNKVIINESAVKHLGWDNESAVGKYLNYTGDEIGKLEVIGVVKDFHFQSLREPVNPFVFMHFESSMWGDGRVLAIRYKEGEVSEIVRVLEQEWSELSDTPFNYSFLDAEFEGIYRSEERMGKLFTMFTILTLMIAAIGLFGLLAYTIAQREKEISIRKIFGASIKNLFLLISKEYAVLIIISFIIAIPLCIIGISKWLENYEYHIDQTFVPYLISGILVTLIVLLTSGYKILISAIKNPVHHLSED